MKKSLVGIFVLIALSTVSWSQGTKEPFDVKKSREEMEIMRGILNTTLSFVAKNMQKPAARWGFHNLSSFYLAGQGAVFVIPTSGFRGSNDDFSFNMDENFSDQMEALNDRMEALRERLEQNNVSVNVDIRKFYPGADDDDDDLVAPAPPAPPAKPAPPAPPVKSEKPQKPEKAPKAASAVDRQEQLRKELEKVQEKAKKTREVAEANREKFLQSLAEVKNYLVETLANYGDSMTTVKADEYINLVLATDGFDSQRTRSDVISARKSWITDYKAGRLTLDAFKQKIVHYNE
jgi:hypothetical protein